MYIIITAHYLVSFQGNVLCWDTRIICHWQVTRRIFTKQSKTSLGHMPFRPKNSRRQPPHTRKYFEAFFVFVRSRFDPNFRGSVFFFIHSKPRSLPRNLFAKKKFLKDFEPFAISWLWQQQRLLFTLSSRATKSNPDLGLLTSLWSMSNKTSIHCS